MDYKQLICFRFLTGSGGGLEHKAKVITNVITKPKPLTLKGISLDSKINKYICKKFGNDCIVALAVVHSENGTMECDRVSRQNTNGTIDRGLWQLNSAYHPFIDDCYKNTDKAYAIYLSRGKSFDRWYGFTGGNYKKFLN